ncbi:hypothetical protein GCM10018785_34360 [Streptomyces longispororuber]|uniref:Uncharacterized protein n=1 Tax=Streptomyces longispororuber TaxID=68230 RepID=A0A919DPF9_9ACTN|nr:hypothetical protein GCM10018785_34360 [Streptomyces longispororuber]
MTKATGDGCFGVLAAQQRDNDPVERSVRLGPYIYTPAPRHPSAPTNGTLTKGGLPVTLRATEPLIREFVEAMSCLEADLSRRWLGTQDRSVFSGAE